FGHVLPALGTHRCRREGLQVVPAASSEVPGNVLESWLRPQGQGRPVPCQGSVAPSCPPGARQRRGGRGACVFASELEQLQRRAEFTHAIISRASPGRTWLHWFVGRASSPARRSLCRIDRPRPTRQSRCDRGREEILSKLERR